MSTNELDNKIKFICLLGEALHKYGTNAQRLEAALEFFSIFFGIKGNFFSTPTYLALSFNSDEAGIISKQMNYQVRVTPGETNLSMLQEIDNIANYVCYEGLKVEEGISQLEQLELQKKSHSNLTIFTVFSTISMALAMLLQGGVIEIILSTIIGSTVGILAILKGRSEKVSDIFEFLAPAIVIISCHICAYIGLQFNYQTVLLSSIIIIVPGLDITIAMSELATKNLVSGTARLMGALMDFLKISFGILLGSQLSKMVLPKIQTIEAVPLPSWSIILAIFIAASSFTIIFNATKRDFKWVLLSCFVTIGALKISLLYVDDIISVFSASFVIGFTSNLFARIKNRPAAITLLPGIILLVPGSVGLKGLNLIFQKNLIDGLAGGMQMFIYATTIVAGLFLANICLNPRKKI